jgi:hypothetical protein
VEPLRIEEAPYFLASAAIIWHIDVDIYTFRTEEVRVFDKERIGNEL